MLARAQAVVQDNRRIPELAHRTFGRFSRVPTDPFLDPARFSWTALLEEHYQAIRAEAEQVLLVRDALPSFQDIARDDITLSDDDQWKTFWFVGYGVSDNPNCLRCPLTAAVLRAIPGLTTGFFSILGSGKSLPPALRPVPRSAPPPPRAHRARAGRPVRDPRGRPGPALGRGSVPDVRRHL
jgi:hypothetical protein